jgi:hypothetical protein
MSLQLNLCLSYLAVVKDGRKVALPDADFFSKMLDSHFWASTANVASF